MRAIYLLGALPFLGILGGIIFADRVEPFILGLPFILVALLVNFVVLIAVSRATGGFAVRGEEQRA